MKCFLADSLRLSSVSALRELCFGKSDYLFWCQNEENLPHGYICTCAGPFIPPGQKKDVMVKKKENNKKKSNPFIKAARNFQEKSRLR